MKINRIVIKNVGPIKDLDLEINGESTVLTGINGSGKTIVLSYIMDCIHEILFYIGFRDVLHGDGIRYDYFRYASDNYKSMGSDYGYVYIDFNFESYKFAYIQVYNCNIETIEKDINLKINTQESYGEKIKLISSSFDKEFLMKLIRNEAIFCMPAYRYERDFWKNTSFFDNQDN